MLGAVNPCRAWCSRLRVPSSQLPGALSPPSLGPIHSLVRSAHSSPTPAHSFPLPTLGWGEALRLAQRASWKKPVHREGQGEEWQRARMQGRDGRPPSLGLGCWCRTGLLGHNQPEPTGAFCLHCAFHIQVCHPADTSPHTHQCVQQQHQAPASQNPSDSSHQPPHLLFFPGALVHTHTTQSLHIGISHLDPFSASGPPPPPFSLHPASA